MLQLCVDYAQQNIVHTVMGVHPYPLNKQMMNFLTRFSLKTVSQLQNMGGGGIGGRR